MLSTTLIAQSSELPNFATITPETLVAELEQATADYDATVTRILKLPPSWENTIQPLEEANINVRRNWNLLNQLNGVQQTEAVRAAYNTVLPKMVAFRTDLVHNPQIYQAYVTIRNSADFAKLSKQQQVVIDLMLLEFQLDGAALDDAQRQKYKQLTLEEEDLSNKYANNVLDATDSWQYFIPADQAQMLDGLPDYAKNAARDKAKAAGKDGWILGLDEPTIVAVTTYAKNRDLRKKIFTAYATLASDQDPDPKRRQWNNEAIIQQMLKLRQELAQLLGYANYADYALADNEAPSPQVVMTFLVDLATKSRPAGLREIDQLKAFAKTTDGITNLEPWDLSYYSDWLKQGLYGVSQQEIRKYLPTEQVLNGLFSLTSVLYNVQITEVKDASVWDPKVKLYVIKDQTGAERGYFYLDLYARPQKGGGAWAGEYLPRLLSSDGKLQLPVTFVVANFMDSQPSMLTHENVVTLFHEFGHMLQYNLTLADYPSIAGTNGVARDAVEMASQFMENWAWQTQVLQDISKSIDSSADMPAEMIEKLIKAKNFQSGLRMLRQMEFAIFDMRLHLNAPADQGKTPMQILNSVRQQYAVVPVLPADRFPNRFRHLFAGGYAARYYGYMWAKVLSADAFAAFVEAGLFNAQVGQKFMQTFLEKGGEDSTLDLFVEFRGREPEVKFLLQQEGIL